MPRTSRAAGGRRTTRIADIAPSNLHHLAQLSQASAGRSTLRPWRGDGFENVGVPLRDPVFEPQNRPFKKASNFLVFSNCGRIADVHGFQRKRERKRHFGAKNGPERVNPYTASRNGKTPRTTPQTPEQARRCPHLRAPQNGERRFHLGTMVEETDPPSKLRRWGRGRGARLQGSSDEEASLASRAGSADPASGLRPEHRGREPPTQETPQGRPAATRGTE